MNKAGPQTALDQLTLRNFLLNLAHVVMLKKDELNRLDATCGDGDLGTGLYQGFSNLQKTLEQKSYDDIGSILASAGNVILSTVGGAAGQIHS